MSNGHAIPSNVKSAPRFGHLGEPPFRQMSTGGTVFQKQAIMRKVVYSLIPIALWSIYLYGWRVVAVGAVVFGVAILSEYVMEVRKGKKVSEAILVTASILTLSFPPGVPLWVAAVAAAFATIIGKGVYGGFGRNIYNPAITGRIFTYISFPLLMQTTWMIPGAFGTLGINGQGQTNSWLEAIVILAIIAVVFVVVTRNEAKTKATLITVLSAVVVAIAVYVVFGYTGLLAPEIDVVSTVTPLEVFRGAQSANLPAGSEYLNNNDLINLFFGFRAGSLGETPIFLILLAGIYLIATKTANWKTILATLLSALVLIVIFYFTGAMARNNPALGPAGKSALESIAIIVKFWFSGSLFFVAVFMATDPISAPNKPASQWIYGILIGGVTILLRVFSAFPEGTSFGILIANTFASFLDEILPAAKKKEAKAAPAPAAGAGAAPAGGEK